MSDDNEWTWGELFIVVFWFVAGLAVGICETRDYCKEKAVRDGHAGYAPDESGRPQWRWKEVGK